MNLEIFLPLFDGFIKKNMKDVCFSFSPIEGKIKLIVSKKNEIVFEIILENSKTYEFFTFYEQLQKLLK